MIETDFETMRQAMVVSQLRPSAVSDPGVIAAMAHVPRERFVPSARAALAYTDRPVPLGAARALNPPLATGLLLDALKVRAGERVLLIGAATGYAAAVLARMGAHVTAVEEDGALVEAARRALAGAANVTLVTAALNEGSAGGAPYDSILIDGAIEHLPRALTAQLRAGGRLAAGLSERGVTRIAVGPKAGEAVVLAGFADVEMVTLPGFAVARGFVF